MEMLSNTGSDQRDHVTSSLVWEEEKTDFFFSFKLTKYNNSFWLQTSANLIVMVRHLREIVAVSHFTLVQIAITL